jgi:hypothetical protein
LAFKHREAGKEKVEVGGALTITFWVSEAGKQAPLLGVTFNVIG